MLSAVKQLMLVASRGPWFDRVVDLFEKLERPRPNLLRTLAYHRVDEADARPGLDPALLSAIPAAFEAQVAYLARHYSVISMAAALKALRGGPPLPERAVLITFDDAYQICRSRMADFEIARFAGYSVRPDCISRSPRAAILVGSLVRRIPVDAAPQRYRHLHWTTLAPDCDSAPTRFPTGQECGESPLSRHRHVPGRSPLPRTGCLSAKQRRAELGRAPQTGVRRRNPGIPYPDSSAVKPHGVANGGCGGERIAFRSESRNRVHVARFCLSERRL